MHEPASHRAAIDLCAADARRLSLAYLGWFAGRYALFVTTAVLVAMWRRQFSSNARAALGEHP